GRLILRTREVRLGERDAQGLELPSGTAELAGAGRLCQTVEDMFGQKFRRGVATLEFGHVVEIAVVEWRQDRLERIVCAADIDHNSIVVEALGDEGGIYHECGAVHALRWSENRAFKGMSDHDVVANFDGEQGSSLRIDDGLAEYPASSIENSRQSLGQIAE